MIDPLINHEIIGWLSSISDCTVFQCFSLHIRFQFWALFLFNSHFLKNFMNLMNKMSAMHYSIYVTTNFTDTYQWHHSGYPMNGNISPKVFHSCSFRTQSTVSKQKELSKTKRNFLPQKQWQVESRSSTLANRSATHPGSVCKYSYDSCIYSRVSSKDEVCKQGKKGGGLSSSCSDMRIIITQSS